MIMQTDSISLPSKSNNIIEVSLRQILFNAIGEHDACDGAIAVITTFIKTMTTLVQLLPNLTSVHHSNELMKRYISSCQMAIQAESLSILQSKYSSELSNIPEELSLSNQGSPIRSASPDLKVPHLRAKTAPRRTIVQPGTRRSLTMVRRKSCDNDLTLSAACFRMSLNSIDRDTSRTPLPPKPHQTPQLRRSKTLDVSKSMDFGANRPSFGPVQTGPLSARKPSLEKRTKTNSLRQLVETEGLTRRNSNAQAFNDAIDVSKSVDWGSFTSCCSSSGNLPTEEPDPEIENHNQGQTRQMQSKVRLPSRPRLSLSKLHFSETERRRALEAESAATKENERRNTQFVQSIEELVAKASPYDEVFATRTKISNE